METELHQLKSNKEKNEEMQTNGALKELPEPFCGHHPDFKGASAALDVRYIV